MLAIAQLRQRTTSESWFMPVRFDNCEIPELEIGAGRTLHSIQRADLFGENYRDEIARLIKACQRVVQTNVASQTASSTPDDGREFEEIFRSWPGVPKTEADLEQIITHKPPYWQLLLFAGVLKLKLQDLEPRYDDYVLGYAPRLGIVISGSDMTEFLNNQFTELLVIGESFERLYSNEAAERAFGSAGVPGAPGAPGDVSRIQRLARRYISIYDELLGWAERLRGVSVPDRYRNLISVLLEYPKQPLKELRRFVNAYAERTAELPTLAKKGEPIYIEHKVTWTIPDDLSTAFRRERDRLRIARN